jgi:outer membrane protein OmpA-like peptidoglycan-associated protein
MWPWNASRARRIGASSAPSHGRAVAWGVLAAAAPLLLARPSAAQEGGVTGSLERFQPAPAGDPMFSVPSATVEGHLLPKATAIVDFAYQPLSIEEGSTRRTIVSHQLFLHLDASLALFDRLLVSVDMPFALAQGGDSPTLAGEPFASPESAEVGDLRLGARVRLLGSPDDPLQIGAGTYFYLPTGPGDSYVGDGAVRGEPHLIVGGRVQQFIYGASLGTTLHASSRPHTFDAHAGAAVLLADELLQVGPELSLSTPFSNNVLVSTSDVEVSVESPTSAELLLGGKLRPAPALVIGAGAGPGLTQGWGTPVFFAVGSVGYEPRAPRAAPAQDSDRDGVLDPVDACPKVPGVESDDPKKNGCPPDRDQDTIPDAKDACPDVPGEKSDDPKKNGCPPDRDKDTILDAEDACPDVAGVKSDDPKKNGCPPDRDGDGMDDPEDACPDVAGVKSDDPKKNGCPPDRDDDGVPDAEDACPDQRGGPDKDPAKNGCPHVTVTAKEIVIQHQVQFRVGQSSLDQTVDPVSDDLLTEVRNAILDNPDIELIEVQGHADVTGPEEFNQKLSEARADAVRRWLIKRGIPRRKLTSAGYGSKAPVASNDSEEGRQENRRVQFVIVRRKSP